MSPPIARLSLPTASANEPVGRLAGLRALPGHRVLVNDSLHRRLLVFDSAMTSFTVVADSLGKSGTKYPRLPVGGLYRYAADSTLFVDWDSRVFLVLGPTGFVARTMAHPSPNDLRNLNRPYAGVAGIDARGRFVYPSQDQPVPIAPAGTHPPVRFADTTTIVRADFDTRRVDTLATVVAPRINVLDVVTHADGRSDAIRYVNPVPTAPDGWAVLSDGSIAVVRAHDYHIDWIYADGTKASTAPMPFDWRRLTDTDKQAKVDSAKKFIDSVSATGPPWAGAAAVPMPDGNGGSRYTRVTPTVAFVPLSEILDYVPPIRPDAVMPDADGNLWILPTTSSHAGAGLLYDVVDRRGTVFQRVQLPAGRSIAGFGAHGTVYLYRGAGEGVYVLERASLPAK